MEHIQQGWTIDLPELKKMYSGTAQAAGLVHALEAPTLEDTEDTYSIYLAPIGLQRGDAEPASEQAAANAVHGLLHGLAALHKAGYVHIYLRWENTACTLQRPPLPAGPGAVWEARYARLQMEYMEQWHAAGWSLHHGV